MHFIPTCPYCGRGCSFYLVVMDKQVLGIEAKNDGPKKYLPLLASCLLPQPLTKIFNYLVL